MAIQLWGEYRPDVSDLRGNNTRVIENVIPRGDGYGPVSDITSYTDALPAACRGAFRAINSGDGSIFIFAGTATGLYLMSNSDQSWLQVSKTDGSDISLGALTSIGNMTGGGGLATVFDGDTTEDFASSATRNNSGNYVGKTMAAPTVIHSAVVYGTNDQGFISGSNPSVTLDLYGKQGTAPANATDGTVIGTVTFTDTADESAGRSITSDSAVLWDHVWVTQNANLNTGIAELTLRGAHTYALPSNGIWQFAQYDDFVVAVQGGDAPQVFEMGTDVFFADLAGSPPTAEHVTVVNEFLLLSGIVSNRGRVQWSARSDITGWTAGTDESDFQDLPDGGDVGPVAGGEHSAILLQDFAMRRMTYQPGNPVIFSFDRISEDVGILAPYSVVKAGQRIFFISNSGFQQSIDGAVPVPIGKERVDNTFIDEWDSDNAQLTFGFPDPRGTRVYWAYKTSAGSDGLFDKILAYDWLLDRWSPIVSIEGEFVTAVAQVGQTLEGLDSLGFTLDTLPISLDAFPASFGKEIGIFNGSHELGFLRGSALEATFETAEQGEPTKQTFISGQRPITDAPEVYGQVSSRQTPGSARVWNTEAAVDSAGLIPARVDTRYYRCRNRIPAGTVWTYSAGTEPQVIQTGNR
jgi:hypothetical protein